MKKKFYLLGVVCVLVFYSSLCYALSSTLGDSGAVLNPAESGQIYPVSQGDLPSQDAVSQLQLNEIIPEGFYGTYLMPAIKGFNGMIDNETGLPYDVVKADNRLSPVDKKVSGLEIGLQILSVIAQRDLGLMTSNEAAAQMAEILDSIDRAAKKDGFLYEFVSLPGLKKAGNVTDVFNSGELAAALMIANQAFKGTDIEQKSQELLDKMNFNYFYSNNGQLYGDSRKGYTVGQFGSEGLLSAIIASLKDNVPDEVVAPSSSIPIHNQTYTTADGREIGVIPAWGGQIWTILMPLLFLGPDVENPDTGENVVAGFTENARRWVEIQADAAKQRGLDIWGWSPCAAASSRYNYDGENGVPELEEYGDAGDPRSNPVAPYVSFLVLGALAGDDSAKPQLQAAVENLEAMMSLNPDVQDSRYGFVDSINQKGQIAPFLLALDKGMEVVGMYNAYQRSRGKQGIEGYFWQYLEANGMAEKARELLGQRSREILDTIGAEAPGGVQTAAAQPQPEPVTPPTVEPETGGVTELPAMDIVAVDWDGYVNGPFGDDTKDRLNSNIVYDDERGAVLKLDYTAAQGKNGYAFDVFTFDKVSIPSGMNYLTVDIKGIPKQGTQFPQGELKIELKQDPQVRQSVYTNEGFGEGWVTLYIPINSYPSWIDALGFVLESHKSSQSGTIYIDRIGFAKERP